VAPGIHTQAAPHNRYCRCIEPEDRANCTGSKLLQDLEMKGWRLCFGAVALALAGAVVWRWEARSSDSDSLDANSSDAVPAPVRAGPNDRATPLGSLRFVGTCDASGAVPVDADHFALADDEDNVIRIYDARHGGKPVWHTNLSKQLALDHKGAESDIEAATILGHNAYWLSSHGRNARGEKDPNRTLLITTDLPTLDTKLEVQGQVYRQLLQDLEQAPSLLRYHLEAAAELAPKEPGGLNLEGLTATPEGSLLIGFRNPVPHGSALLVPLLNPDALATQSPLRFGAAIELGLGGLGVRALSYWHGRYLIAAGPTGKSGASRLYRWQGPNHPPEILAEELLRDLNPEAFFSSEHNTDVLVLSDDGGRRVRGKPCKRLDHKRHKSFRGLWLRVPP
jgi:hypothetical protein